MSRPSAIRHRLADAGSALAYSRAHRDRLFTPAALSPETKLLSRRNNLETGHWSSPLHPETFQEEARMSDMAEVSLTHGICNRLRAVGRRLLPTCFVGALVIAMAGWLWAIGWVVLGAVNWLLA
jgi:hypothetical protein